MIKTKEEKEIAVVSRRDTVKVYFTRSRLVIPFPLARPLTFNELTSRHIMAVLNSSLEAACVLIKTAEETTVILIKQLTVLLHYFRVFILLNLESLLAFLQRDDRLIDTF